MGSVKLLELTCSELVGIISGSMICWWTFSRIGDLFLNQCIKFGKFLFNKIKGDSDE